MRRIQHLLFPLILALSFQSSAWAQANFPDKPVRIMVGASTPETVARTLVPKLTEALGQPVVVEVMQGASGNIAAERVARSAPDGYTLLMSGDAAMTTNVTLFSKLGYDPTKDFAPITLAVDSVNILAVHPSVAAKSVQELVALAKAEPGIMSLLPLVREGKLRGVAVTSLQRAPKIPELPTIAESGYPGFEATAWVGLLAPAGTPQPIVRRLQQEMAKVMSQPELRDKLLDHGLTIVGSTPEEFGAQIQSEIPKKAKLVRAAGAKID